MIGDDKTQDASTQTERATEHTLAIHVWSRNPGTKESRTAAAAVLDALDGAALTITGHTLIDLRWLDTITARDPDGETIHATLRFRALLEPQ